MDILDRLLEQLNYVPNGHVITASDLKSILIRVKREQESEQQKFTLSVEEFDDFNFNND